MFKVSTALHNTHVIHTSVSQENLSANQESSSSEQETKCKGQVYYHLQARQNMCQPCLCFIKRVPRWIGQSMMACITGS